MMKRIAIAGATALALVAMTPAADLAAQDVAGRWVLSVDLDVGSGDATFVFESDGNEFSGTYSGTLGERVPVTGTVDGSTVRFTFSVDEVGDVEFRGTIEGDEMSGSCTYGMLGAGTFSGSRRDG